MLEVLTKSRDLSDAFVLGSLTRILRARLETAMPNHKMLRKIAKRVAAWLANAGAHRLIQEWSSLSRDEWRFVRPHFSQYGEDLIVDVILSDVEKGCYVDVGAFHPIHFSNTHLLYRRGWRGVNIDLDAEKIALFRTLKPDDISVAAAVGSTRRQAWAHRYTLAALNRVTFDPTADPRAENGDLPIQTVNVDVRPLDDVLDAMGFTKRIDFLNVDCEGFELEVLGGFTFSRWQPRLVALEALNPARHSALRDAMAAQGYEEIGRLYITVFYAPRKAP